MTRCKERQPAKFPPRRTHLGAALSLRDDSKAYAAASTGTATKKPVLQALSLRIGEKAPSLRDKAVTARG
jgi:hypothetical protein